MHELELPGGRHLRLDASPRLEAAARQALRWIREAIGPNDTRAGGVVNLMWWPLEIAPDGAALRVLGPLGWCTPREDLSPVLGLFVLQLAAAKRVGVEALGFDVDGVVHVAPGVFDAPRVMMRRDPEPPTRDGQPSTGWFLRPDGPLTTYDDDYEVVPAAELLRRRGGLLAPLALPSGLLVVVEGDTIVSVLDVSPGAPRPPVDRWAR